MAFLNTSARALISGRTQKDYLNGPNETGTISGVVKTRDNKGRKFPAYARVTLIRESDFVPVRSMMSDKITGAYSFSGIDSAVKYTAIAYDHLNIYEPATGSALFPK